MERLRELDEPAILAREKADWDRNVQRTAQGIARNKGRETAGDEDRREAESQLRTRAAAGVKERAAERGDAIERLLASPSSALLLADALGENRMPASVRAQVLAASLKLPDAQVRDLFERFVPDDQRVKTLGSVIKPEQLLALKGNAERGRQSVLQVRRLAVHQLPPHQRYRQHARAPTSRKSARKRRACRSWTACWTPRKPSSRPTSSTWWKRRMAGSSRGLLGIEDGQGSGAQGGGRQGGAGAGREGGAFVPLRKSLMPDLLLRDLTAEQAADLLEFLSGLK